MFQLELANLLVGFKSIQYWQNAIVTITLRSHLYHHKKLVLMELCFHPDEDMIYFYALLWIITKFIIFSLGIDVHCQFPYCLCFVMVILSKGKSYLCNEHTLAPEHFSSVLSHCEILSCHLCYYSSKLHIKKLS